MGYYATGEGYIKTKDKLPEEILAEAESIFEQAEYANNVLDVAVYDKYHEDDVLTFLENIKKYTAAGEIFYEGEDSSYWKFVFNDGEWEELNGHVVYDDEPAVSFKPGVQDEFLGCLIDQVEDIFGKEDKIFVTEDKYDILKTKFEETLRAWHII